MKFTSSNTTWTRGITSVQNAVGSAVSNPMIENIHLSCEGNTVSFLATNLNLTMKCEGEAHIEEPGQIVLPSKIITPIVRDLPKEDVIFEVQDETVKITCGKFKARMKGQSGSLFPPFNLVETGETIVISAEKLKDMIRKTIIATSTEKARYELDGVLFHVFDNEFRAVAVDGRRLSMCAIKDIPLPENEINAFIPSKTLNELLNSLPDEGEITITIQDRRIQFKSADITVISNLLMEKFPQYSRIIPPEGDQKVIFNRTNFASAAKRAANLTNQKSNMLTIYFENDLINIVGELEEVGGEGRDSIDAEYNGESISVCYNYKYLNDFVRVVDEETVELDIKDPKKPGTFRGVGNEQFLYVLMPMRPPDEDKKDETTEEEQKSTQEVE